VPPIPQAPVIAGRVRYAPGSRQPAHADDVIQISLVLRGSLVERVGRREEPAGPLSLVIKARGVVHQDEYGPGGALLFGLALHGDAGERLVDDLVRLPVWRWTHGAGPLRPLVRLLVRLAGSRTTLAGDDPDVLSVLAAVTDSSTPPPHGPPPVWLEQVRQRLDDEPRMRVGAAALDAGVHPVYLARCFRRWYGCSVAGYLQRVRLRRAAALLPVGTVGRAAHHAGFADQAHFTHRFREATGLTPARFRAVSSWSAPAVERLARHASP
jgi:AraC family transcriptional regulator